MGVGLLRTKSYKILRVLIKDDMSKTQDYLRSVFVYGLKKDKKESNYTMI